MINWIACLFIFYYSGFNLISLFALFDGIYHTFTKWHVALILVSLTTLLFGSFGLGWFGMCILTLLTALNWQNINTFFEMIKKSINLANKMSKLPIPDEMNKEMKAIEFINGKLTWATQKYEMFATQYDQKIKSKFIKNINLCIESNQWAKLMDVIMCIDTVIAFILDTLKKNGSLLYDSLQNVYLVKILKEKYDNLYDVGKITYDLTNSNNKYLCSIKPEQEIQDNKPLSIENQTQMANDFLDTLTTMMNDIPLHPSKNNAPNFDNMFVDFQKMLGCEIGDLAEKKISLRQKNKKSKQRHR